MDLNIKNESVVERVSTGIPKLDEVIEGGFPRPSVVALVGASGCGTTSFCKGFVGSSLMRGKRVLLLLADEARNQYLRHFTSIQNLDIEPLIESKRLVIVDLFRRYMDTLGIKGIADLESVKDIDATDVMRSVQSYLEGEMKIELRNLDVVLDSLTALSPFMGVRGLHSTILETRNVIRAHNDMLILVGHDGALEGNFVQTLRQYADSVIRMRMRWVRSELKREMMIEKVSFTEIREPVLEFKITDAGIEIT